MKIECGNCHKAYDIPDERLPERETVSFPCPSCKEIIELRPHKTESGQEEKPSPEAGETGETLKRKILKTVKDLPPMPQTVLKAQSIMKDPNAGFKELAKVLETDQALAAKVLRMANSPYYSLSGEVSSLQRASVVLGQKTLEELITLAGASGILGVRLEGYGLDSGYLWQHSIGVAFGSKIIAKKRDSALADAAFSAGLIHDTGKLALDPYVLERGDAFRAFLDKGQESFTSAEKEILGFDHAEIAGQLCTAWGVPKGLIDAITFHHSPDRSNGNKLAYIVHAADAIAMMSGIGAGIDGLHYALDPRTPEVLQIGEKEMNEVMMEMVESVQRISEEMEVLS